MPVYRIALHGIATPLLVRDESAAKAKDQILDLKALTTEEMADALAAGETIYKSGDSVLGKAAAATAAADERPTYRVNTENGMYERRPNDSDEWASEGPASLDDLRAAFGSGEVEVNATTGKVHYLPAGAKDGGAWVEVRDATKEEIAAITPPPSPSPSKK